MKAKENGKKAINLKKRQPYERLDETTKWKIGQEVRSGIIGLKPACKKYGVSRNSIRAWISKTNLVILLDEKTVEAPFGMTESEQTRQLVKKYKS